MKRSKRSVQQPARKPPPPRRKKEPPANHKKVPLALVRGKRMNGASGARGGTRSGCDLSLPHGVSRRDSGKFDARSSLTEDGSLERLGTFATAEEAGQAVVAYEYANRHLRKQKPVPMTVEQVHAAVAAEGLTLTPGSGCGGFMNVSFCKKTEKYVAKQRLGGKPVYHGIFFTPEEAALACARAFKAHNA